MPSVPDSFTYQLKQNSDDTMHPLPSLLRKGPSMGYHSPQTTGQRRQPSEKVTGEATAPAPKELSVREMRFLPH